MTYSISYFIGDQRNASNGEVFSFKSFKALSDEFSKCAKGAKHSAYFVRGELSPVARKDVNLASSNIIIIDGDEGIRGRNAPDPKEVHDALIELNLNHFIYTTHSHSKDKNKFRCVVEAGEHTKEQLKFNNGLLLSSLSEKGVPIKFVTEMSTWSQPWFVPTRDDPEDGLFESYSYTKGIAWEIQTENITNLNKVAETESSSINTLDEMYENIRTGKEYHESLRNISYQLVKDGVPSAHVKSQLRSMLNSSLDSGSERWQARYDDINRLVDGAVDRLGDQEFAIDTVEAEDVLATVNPIPHPPGLLGKLCDEAYESSRYPDKQIALVSSLGVIAGICGRKFNVDFADGNGKTDPTALNLYMTLVGNTGSGKDGIKAFIERILYNGSGIKPAASFLGSGEFTSVRALDQQTKDARSQVTIDGEAGISMKNNTGDRAGVRKAILSLYGRGHHTAWSDPKTYSNADETIPPRRAIALTRISESTEIELFAAYRDVDAFENGLIPRQSIFRIINPTTKYNRGMRTDLSPDIISKFNALIEVCSAVQAVDDPDSHFIHCNDEELIEHLYDYADELKARSVDVDLSRIAQVMSSRMFVKALRYAGIAVVFNKNKADTNCLLLGWEEWKWARAMVEYEMDTVENCFAGYEEGSDAAVMKVVVCLSKLINKTHKSQEARRVPEDLRRINTIPLSVVQRILRKDVDIKRLAADPTRTSQIQDGVLKCLDYMQKVGTVVVREDKTTGSGIKGSRKVVKLLPAFNEMYARY